MSQFCEIVLVPWEQKCCVSTIMQLLDNGARPIMQQAIKDLKSKLHALWAWLLSQNLSRIDFSTSLHNGQTRSINTFTLALHMFIVIDLIQLAQMKHGSFLLLYLCQVLVHLSLKLGGNRSTHLFSTMFTLSLKAFNNFHTKATKYKLKFFTTFPYVLT